MNRKLATIIRINDIIEHPNADRLDIAIIKGWKCVVNKGQFQFNDIAIYVEIDSFLPENDKRFKFLKKSSSKIMNDEKGYRLKTIKLRGQLSQGLLLPLSSFPELKNNKIGDDVTELLNVKLYEPPIPACLAGDVKGMFPSFGKTTDQERIQNLLEYFETMKDVWWEATLKMDGSSASYYYNNQIPEPFGVCSRKLDLKESKNNTFWKVANKLHLKERLEKFNKEHNRNIMIQAELCGEGIQSNKMKIKGHNIFVYDIFDIDKHKYICPSERMEILDELNKWDEKEIKHVPIHSPSMKVFNLYNTFDELHDWINGITGINGTMLEGVVFKSCKYINEQIISFKIINNNYI